MKKTNEKGITLIALVITIIIMILLTMVTINVLFGEEGILKNAKIASSDTEKKSILEELIAMAELDRDVRIDVDRTADKAINKYGATYDPTIGKLTVTGKTGTYYYKITKKEISIWDDITPPNSPLQLSNLEKYVLGENGTGRNIWEILDEDDEYFKSDEKNSINAEDIEIIFCKWNEDEANYYIKYQNDYLYDIVVEVDSEEELTNTQNCKFIYKLSGNEGKRVGEVISGSEFSNWIILYEYEDRIEAVSPTVMGSLKLGCEETPAGGWISVMGEADIDKDGSLTDIEKSIYSYNHAIDTINNACKNLISSITDKNRIRSVGAKTDPTEEKYNSLPEEPQNSIYNGKIKAIDNEYESDFVIMTYLNILSADNEYWISSRCQEKGYTEFGCFRIRDGSSLSTSRLFRLAGDYIADSPTLSLRPVITISTR